MEEVLETLKPAKFNRPKLSHLPLKFMEINMSLLSRNNE